ncbi:MAG TPA: ATP-binding protein [Chthoniobacteraceae bacterium]|nr:ATP-binding protein [Chthoniobacteraceae bacterium]
MKTGFAVFIPLVGCVCNLLLALTVLRSSVRIFAHRVYFFLCICIAIWNLGQYFLFVIPSNENDAALFWARFCWFGVIFIPLLLFHLSLLIAQIQVGKYIRYFYAFCFLMAASDFTPLFLRTDIRYLGTSGWYARASAGVYVFSVFPFMLVYGSLVILFLKRKAMPPLHRKRLDALIFGQCLLVVLGMNDILPVIGIEKYPLTNIQIFPYGALAAAFYGLIGGYSVLHHQLLDVHIALGRMAAQLIRFAFLFFTGLILLLTATLFAPSQFTITSFFTALAVLMISGIVASIYFPRVFGTGSESLEKRILGDRFEYHDQIRSFIASMQMYTDTTLLLSDLHDLLLKTIRVRHYQIILLDETSRVFSLFRAHPEQPVEPVPGLQNDSAIFRFFQTTKSEYLAFNITYTISAGPQLEREAREQLRKFDAEFCFQFLFEEEPFGLLLIGEKDDEQPYTGTDLELFVSLSKNLGLMINQIRLKNQILQAQELELLGRMSRGMAHDLNNLLTPVWTFLQLSNEGASIQDLSEDLLPVALRNIKSMRAYIREALFFSENLRPDFQLGRLDVVITQAVDIVRAKTEKSVDILVSSPGEVLVEMDEVLIQRLIANIVSNGVDASQPGSTIHIELLRLVKTETNRDWLRVRIVDSGEGIKAEDLNRVFTPYFTTKNRGDAERGFGLGLAICRKIVHLHGGNLNIASQVKKGTTVQIDLPNRQVKPPISVASTPTQQ